MFGSVDVAVAAGAGVAFTTLAGSVCCAACAWATDAEARVVAAVKAVKRAIVVLCVLVMTGPICSRRAGPHASRRETCCTPRSPSEIRDRRAPMHTHRADRAHARVRRRHGFLARGETIAPMLKIEQRRRRPPI